MLISTSSFFLKVVNVSSSFLLNWSLYTGPKWPWSTHQASSISNMHRTSLLATKYVGHFGPVYFTSGKVKMTMKNDVFWNNLALQVVSKAWNSGQELGSWTAIFLHILDICKITKQSILICDLPIQICRAYTAPALKKAINLKKDKLTRYLYIKSWYTLKFFSDNKNAFFIFLWFSQLYSVPICW